MLRVGDWLVNPKSGQISRNGETARLEERSMRLLLCLAARPGEVVSIDELLNQVWAGVTVTPDSVYQAVATLRRQLGDDPKEPTYIATVPRLGYRMVAAVGPLADPPPAPAGAHRRSALIAGTVAAICIAVAGVFVFHARSAPRPLTSVAVLPFLDLTEHMAEEEFADGMTEELIGRLGRIPGLRVPALTSVFHFKSRRVPPAEIAKSLGVAWILDGSVRKSGERLRVAARLIRADNGDVVWSQSYDRRWGDFLTVQDDIAGEVTKALRASIGAHAQ